jgi:hypothetical protein
MRAITAIRIATIVAMLASPAVLRADDDSIKEGFEEVGRGVENGTKKAWDKTKEGTEKAWDKTKDGTGKAMEKTGEGLDKAGDKVEDAGEDVKD